MLTRRELARFVGASLAGAALGCGDDLLPLAGGAVLEPAPEALLVAVWCEAGARVHVEVYAGDELVREADVELGEGGSGAIDIGGLQPSTAYDVVVRAASRVLATYRARTAPADDDARPVRIAVSADVDAAPMWDSPLVDHVLAVEPEVYISLGDFPYADNGPDVAATVAAYRDRYARMLVSPHGRRLLQGVGVRAIYDDHEFHNDWDAKFAAELPERYAAAVQVWDEFFPVRGARDDVRYRSWRWGRNVECFMLDTRRFRSANTDADTDAKTMLGAAQEAWLADALARSTATFKLVLTSVPLDFGVGDDHWATFTAARARLFAAAAGVPGVLYLTADQHWFASHRHAGGQRELQFGPLARGVLEPGPPRPEVLARVTAANAGILDVIGDAITVRAIGADGATLYEERLTLADLG